MKSSTIPVRLTHLWRRVGDNVVVISDANFNLIRFEFNRVGGRVWELMDGATSVQEIANSICNENPSVPQYVILSSVEDFLGHLQSEWLMATREELAEYE